MKIYTKTGDEGLTGLFAGPRVRKDHPRIAAYGTIDELNAAIGVARTEWDRSRDPAEDPLGISATLDRVQHRLFDLGAELATPVPEGRVALLGEVEVVALEGAIDSLEATLPPLRQFILPAGSPAAAQAHMARCICRRAEREVVALAAAESVRELPVRYLNRLSDLLFVMARGMNHALGVGDTPWRHFGEGSCDP